MGVVRSFGELEAVYPRSMSSLLYSRSGSVPTYDGLLSDYAALYKSQPWVRICVDFFARNVAHLTIHGFEKISQTDRQPAGDDHPAVRILHRPNPWTTHYRMLRGLTSDRKIYDRAYLLKIYAGSIAGEPTALLRIPAVNVETLGGLWPTGYQFQFSGKRFTAPPSDVIHLRGYNPDSSVEGLSPLETLRRTLAEEDASAKHRETLWRRGARMGGIVERPVEAPEWDAGDMKEFRESFERLYSGIAGAGATAVLEEGMKFRQVDFSAEATQYVEARKLNREEVGAAFHIPLSQIQILEHATLTNVREQHKTLYQDTLGPDLEETEQDLMLQLVPEFAGVRDVSAFYLKFNIREKLRGSFDEESAAITSAVGGPWMTAAEGRAMFELGEQDGADELLRPLNMEPAGAPRELEPAPPKSALEQLGEIAVKALLERHAGELEPEDVKARRRRFVDPHQPRLRARHVSAWAAVMRNHFERQRRAIEKVLNRKAPAATELLDVLDNPRWDAELAADLRRMNHATAIAWARHTADALGVELDESRLEAWLRSNADKSAVAINAHTREQVSDAAGFGIVGVQAVDPDEVRNVFEIALGSRAAQIAATKVTGASMFGAHAGAEQGGARTKRWRVNSNDPRSAHRALNGEETALGDSFSNGMQWPGDPAGGADNNANCQCSIEFGTGE